MQFSQMGEYHSFPPTSWTPDSFANAGAEAFPSGSSGQAVQGMNTAQSKTGGGESKTSYGVVGGYTYPIPSFNDPRNEVQLQTGDRFQQLLDAKLEMDYQAGWSGANYPTSASSSSNVQHPVIPEYDVEALLHDLNQTQIPPDLVAPLPPPMPFPFTGPGQNPFPPQDYSSYSQTPQWTPYQDPQSSRIPFPDYHYLPHSQARPPSPQYNPQLQYNPYISQPSPSPARAYMAPMASSTESTSAPKYDTYDQYKSPFSAGALNVERHSQSLTGSKPFRSSPSISSTQPAPASTTPPTHPSRTSSNEDRPSTDAEEKKVVIACNLCRARKLKCDGTRPRCLHCAKRDENVCVYQETLRRRGPGKKPKKSRSSGSLAAGEPWKEAYARTKKVSIGFQPDPGDPT